MNSLAMPLSAPLRMTPVQEPAAPALRTLPHTQSFDDVRRAVAARAERMLPDVTVHTAELRMTQGGHIALPGGVELSLNPWSRKQLASLLGIRWDKWFATSTPAERADEVTRRFARTPGALKVRAWRSDSANDDGADGVARAFLAPTFTPIDDARIFERAATMLRGLVDDYRFTAVTFTDSTTLYTAVRADGIDLDGGGDVVHPGWCLRNSEVGASALSLDDYWLRLVCSNGLMVKVGGKRALYRTHRAIEDDQLAAALLIALGRLPERATLAAGMMRAARLAPVPHPDDAVAAVLGDSAEVPKAVMEAAQKAALLESPTRFGVVQAITLAAHTANTDPDVRFAMERLAGDYLTA